MNSILFLIPIALLLLIIAVGAFFWASRNGQFDDLETPALQIILDDEPKPSKNTEDGPV